MKVFETIFKVISALSFIFIIYPLSNYLINMLGTFSTPIIFFTRVGPSLVMFFLLLLNGLIGIIPIVPVVILAVFGYFSFTRAIKCLRSHDCPKFRKLLSILYFISIGEVVLYIIYTLFRGAYLESFKVLLYVSVLLSLSTSGFLSLHYYLLDRCVEEMYSPDMRGKWNIIYICLEAVSLIVSLLLISYSLPILIQLVILNVLFIALHVVYVRIFSFK